MQWVDDSLNSYGFDDDECFHRFYSNSTTLTEEGPRHGQDKQYRSQQRRRRRENYGSTSGGVPTSGDWEVIPASPKVQWASASLSRSEIQMSNTNEFNGINTGDSDSAWSVPESTTSSSKFVINPTDTKQNKSSNLPRICLVDVRPNESERQRQLQKQHKEREREKELADRLFNDVEGGKRGGGSMLDYLSQSTAKRDRGRR